MIINLTADGLRRAADALDRLASIEAETGIKFDGAYNGHIMLTVDDGETGQLRLVRLIDGLDPDAEARYALEFEVP